MTQYTLTGHRSSEYSLTIWTIIISFSYIKQFCISPVYFLCTVVYCEPIGPMNILSDNCSTIGAVHFSSLYFGLFTPICPKHEPETIETSSKKLLRFDAFSNYYYFWLFPLLPNSKYYKVDLKGHCHGLTCASSIQNLKKSGWCFQVEHSHFQYGVD